MTLRYAVGAGADILKSLRVITRLAELLAPKFGSPPYLIRNDLFNAWSRGSFTEAAPLASDFALSLWPLRKYLTVPSGTPLPGATTSTADGRTTATTRPCLLRSTWTIKIDCVPAVDTASSTAFDFLDSKLESPAKLAITRCGPGPIELMPNEASPVPASRATER